MKIRAHSSSNTLSFLNEIINILRYIARAQDNKKSDGVSMQKSKYYYQVKFPPKVIKEAHEFFISKLDTKKD